MKWYLRVIQKYADFSGRARRTEYWMFVLINFIISLFISFLEYSGTGPGVISSLYTLFILLPSLAVTVRRLHDTGRSGWWFFIIFIPLGIFVLLYFLILEGHEGENYYGSDPKLETV